ncbi:hypothetical protein PInf_027791 [Phytophthora infestans]|nr:hypothetical protein PInf_027791 [Phytophthora infestans]
MVKLFCALAGAAGSAFSVRVDKSDTVDDLRNMIRDHPQFGHPNSKLQLFLAKKGGAWLNSDGAAAVTLDEHGNPQGFDKMDPSLWIKNDRYFGEKFQPNEGQIHVLAVVPTEAAVVPALSQQSFFGRSQSRWWQRLKMIGTRMLYQLQESDWTMFNANPVNQVFPAEVLTKLSAITETDSNRMCVILCVDSLQKLQHEPGSKHSEFYTAFASLCDLVNASKCWLIVICAATIYQPVDEFLAASPQWREMLQTTSLKRPKIDGRDVFDTFDYGNGALTQLLVDDMGGHGRALEELFNVMLQNQGQAFEFIPVMHNVLAAIRQAYPAIVAQMQSMKQAFLAVISRRRVDGNSLFGILTLDQVISCGLIRLDGTQLQCPFILYMLLETHDIPWSKHATYAPAERLEDLKPWQLWEHFNCKFRVLKSQAFAQEESVLWTDIHHGARFGDGCNRRVIERQLTYALADKRMPTKTKGFKEERCSCGNDQGKCFLYQPADGSPSGDAFLCLEDATKGFFHEVHQCKCVEGNLSLDVFEQERLKAAGPDDLFILYCTSLVTTDLCLLPNSAFVDATCWEAYYGPFAARAFFIKSVPLPCINTSSEVQLEFVEGVGPAYRARIAKKRPFTSLEDAFVKTKIPVKVLRRFKFNTDSR